MRNEFQVKITKPANKRKHYIDYVCDPASVKNAMYDVAYFFQATTLRQGLFCELFKSQAVHEFPSHAHNVAIFSDAWDLSAILWAKGKAAGYRL